MDFISGTTSDSYIEDISAYISANTVIRFGNTGGAWSTGSDRAYLDNIVITANFDIDGEGIDNNSDNCPTTQNLD